MENDEKKHQFPKDHIIAAMVNELTAAVPAYSRAQCLRTIISNIVLKHLKGVESQKKYS